MKILGIDIGNGLATCCPLDHMPPDPRQINIDGKNFFKCKANAEGIKTLLKIHPDIAVLEPTGTNYSKLWCQHLATNGVEVRLVSHSALAAHRSVCGIPDKDDESDSLTLAHYGWFYLNNPERFIRIRDAAIATLQRDCLRLEHLNRIYNPMMNRLRQDLAWQFPEAAQQQIRQSGDKPHVFLRWLAGQAKWKRYDQMYAETIGLGLTDEVRYHARRLVDIVSEEIEIENRVRESLNREEYELLRKAFNAFGFGTRLQGSLIAQIYPFEDFLGVDGEAIIKMTRGKESGNLTKKYLSRRRFEKALGAAPTRKQSGKEDKKQVVGGSSLCRSLLWWWVHGQCNILKVRANHPVKTLVYQWETHPKRKAAKTRLLKMKTISHASRLLFKTLVAFKLGKIPKLISSFPDADGCCNSCGKTWVGDRCEPCDELSKKLDLWFSAYLQ